MPSSVPPARCVTRLAVALYASHSPRDALGISVITSLLEGAQHTISWCLHRVGLGTMYVVSGAMPARLGNP